MSGICGVYGKGDVDEMTRQLSHRGPDDMGFYLEGQLQFGVRRLAVVDIAGGRQPISDEGQKVWAMLDGEVFNHGELRRDLVDLGHDFRTGSDTEVIVHAWEEWGPASLERFNGQFAIALWDGRRLHLVRDRLGEKPLYYYLRGGRLLFASEIKSLITQVSSGPKFTDEFRDFESPAFGDTLFSNIKELPPAHRASFDGKKFDLVRWWSIPRFDGPFRKDKDYVDELRWLVKDSVRLRVEGEIEVGVLLSGGLDSAAIAGLAGVDRAFCVAFPKAAGEEYDELEYARLVAKNAKMKLKVVRPAAKSLQEKLPGIIWALDQPVASLSSLADFMLAEEASKKVKAVLVGQGADELFGGHVRHLMMLAEDRLAQADAFKSYLPLARYFWGPDMFADPDYRYYSLINRGPAHDPKCRAVVKNLFQEQERLIDKMGATDLQLLLPTVLTMDDRATAVHGIENRNPFLDHRIVEFAFRLPSELKVSGFDTKVVLRRAMKGIVPEPVIDRADKMGLAVPVGKWIAKDIRRWANVRVNRFRERYEANFLNAAWDAAGDRGEFDRKDYMRLCLELWMEIMFEKEVEEWDAYRPG